jgi:hypothetical protein
MSKKKKARKVMKEVGPPEPRGFLEGKYVVVFLALMGLAAGLVSWGYYVQLQRRPMEFWETDGAKLLMKAPDVAALRLVPADKVPAGTEAIAIFSFGGQRWAEIERRDISQVGGLGIMRQTLLNDNSYGWSDKLDECQPVWQYALTFSDPQTQESTMLLLSLDCPRAMRYEKQEMVSIRPAAEALRKFLVGLFEERERKEEKGDAKR